VSRHVELDAVSGYDRNDKVDRRPGANVNDAAKGTQPCRRARAADPAEVRATTAQGGPWGPGRPDIRTRGELVESACGAQVGAPTQELAMGFFVDVADVDDMVDISVARAAEKARSFTS
jgi:hypothetical protein